MLIKCPECDFVTDLDAKATPRFVCEECSTRLRVPGTPPRKRKKGKGPAKGGPDNTTRNIIGGVVLLLVALAGVAVWGSKLGWFDADAKKEAVADGGEKPQLAPQRPRGNPRGNPAPGKQPGNNRAPNNFPGNPGMPGFGPAPDPEKAAYQGVLAAKNVTRPTKDYATDMKESAEEEIVMALDDLKPNGKTFFDSDFYTFTLKFTDDNFRDYKKVRIRVSFDDVPFQQPFYFQEIKPGISTFGIDTTNVKQPFSKMTVWFEAEPNAETNTRGRKLCKPVSLMK